MAGRYSLTYAHHFLVRWNAALFASPNAREKAQLCSNKEVVFPSKNYCP